MPNIRRIFLRDGTPRFPTQVRLAGEVPLYCTLDSYDAALEWARAAEADLLAGRAARILAQAPPAPLGELKDEELWRTLEYFAASPRSTRRDQTSIVTINRHIGNETLEVIDDNWGEDFLDRMRKTKAKRKQTFFVEATLKKMLSAINKAITWRARRLKVERPNPTIDTKLILRGKDNARHRRLEAHEGQAMRSHFRTRRGEGARHWRCVIMLALATGARLEELVGAPWAEFDIESRSWNLPAHRTKARKARSIPLGKRALRILRLLRADADPSDPLLFHKLGNSHSVSNNFRHKMHCAGVFDFRFHDLRHEAAVRFVKRARNMEDYTKIMKCLGHVDYTTFDRYITFTHAEIDGIFG